MGKNEIEQLHLHEHVAKHDPQASSYIHKIVPQDKKLLRETVHRIRPQSKKYEDSWGYIIQATRYGGFKWYDPLSGSLLFLGRKSASDSTLVVSNFFASPEYLRDVVDRVQTALIVPRTIIKNINQEDVPLFIPYGFRPYSDNEQWSALARFDDQTYPQLIIDLQELLKKEGRRYRHLRRALSKNPHAQIRAYQGQDRDAVLTLFAAKDNNTTKPLTEQKRGMYYESHAMYPDADLDKFVIVDDMTEEVIGFTSFSAITSETTASVASIFRPYVGVASIWGAYQTLLAIYQQGFRYVNFGGNETEGSYRFFREKFHPIEAIHKTHLVYDNLHAS